jgi:hypothetical protein
LTTGADCLFGWKEAMAQVPTNPPFPIASLAKRVVRALIAHRLELLQRAVVPIVAWAILLRLAASVLVPEGHEQKVIIAAVVGCVVVVLHFVISWHRLLQRGPRFAGHRFGFWIGDSEWKLIGHGILFAVFWSVIHFTVGWIDGRFGAAVGWTAWIAGAVLFYGFLSRHLLMFPMTAVDEEAKFGGSWDLTRPCWGPFVALIALFGLPMGGLFIVSGSVLSPDTLGLEVFLVLQGVAAVFGAAVMATVLSVVYMELRPPTPAPREDGSSDPETGGA